MRRCFAQTSQGTAVDMSNSPIDYSRELGEHCIVIIDDEPLSQDCLAEAMRGEFPDLRIVGCSTIRDLYWPREAVVEAVLLKVKSQPIDLNDLTQDIKAIGRHFAQAPVIVISSRDDAFSTDAAIAAGAQGLIPITAALKIAIAALRLVMAGGTYFPHPHSNTIVWSNGILNGAHETTGILPADVLVRPVPYRRVPQIDLPEEPETDGINAAFTAREVDVLTALRQGRSNKWIAHFLNLSENTVKVHIRHIMRKLNVTNRTEAAILSQSLITGNTTARGN